MLPLTMVECAFWLRQGRFVYGLPLHGLREHLLIKCAQLTEVVEQLQLSRRLQWMQAGNLVIKGYPIVTSG